MSHVNDLFQAERMRLSTIYPSMPKCAVVGDEPAGDFGIAHYLGRDVDGCFHFTFDVGSQPHIKTVAHELWHAAHEIGAGNITPYEARFKSGAAYVTRLDDPVILGFHKAIGYTVPLQEIVMTANIWHEYISEQMAEAFGYIVAGFRTAPSGHMWARWGGDLEANRERVAEFFRSVQPKEVVKEDDMNAEETKTLIRQMLESPEGTLKVRAALTRPTETAPDDFVKGQFKDTEDATRRWIVGL